MFIILAITVLFKPILFTSSNNFKSNFIVCNLLFENPKIFSAIKVLFIISCFIPIGLISKLIFSFLYAPKTTFSRTAPSFEILVGKDENGNKVYIPEKGLYQNILITGSIGSGKTASAMYPFTKQLLKINNESNKKLAFLILDVKGNYYKKVLEFAKEADRLDDVVVIELGGKYCYNPLDKQDLKATVLANRLKEILLLFSPNNSESYWLDKAEAILEASINFIRLYNNQYVSFDEIHNLITDKEYFDKKVHLTRNIFTSGKLSNEEAYLLLSSISFLEKDYFSLDERNFNILKSEITRITNPFVSDYEVKKTFCPDKKNENFYGFEDCLKNGKIVVLNMNIARYKNLSKIIAAYLKLDFQTDVIKALNSNTIRPSAFISDEYQEYVTTSDANFYAQSREAKCINIIATQSYTSILNTLNNQNASKVIIQNLVNKFWFRTDDIYTIEDIQKQIGKEEKTRVSKTISENSKENNYSLVSHDFTAFNSSLSESVNEYSQLDFVYDYNFFTQNLNTFSCVAFLSDGDTILKPCKLNMIPYFKEEI